MLAKLNEWDKKVTEWRKETKLGRLIYTAFTIMAVFSILVAMLGFIPFEREVVAPGDIVSVREMIDLNDSREYELYYTEVKHGYTTNLLRFLQLRFKYEQLETAPINLGVVSTKEMNKVSSSSRTEMVNNAIIQSLKSTNQEIEYSKTVQVDVLVSKIDNSKQFVEDDIILEVNGQEIQSSKQLSRILQDLEGKTFTVKVSRDNNIELLELPVLEEFNGLGHVGFYPKENIEFEEPTLSLKEKITLTMDGGDSAGLMLTLDLIQQMTKVDLTKGYKIAGTGAIDEEGNILSVGSIRQKIITAHLKEVDVFFVPEGENAEEAIRTASEFDYTFPIVPVATLQDALDYLDKL